VTDADQHTLVGAVANVSDRLITSLPAQFLVLVLLNTAFITGLLWFLNQEQTNRYALEDRQVEGREKLLLPLLQACITQGMNPAK